MHISHKMQQEFDVDTVIFGCGNTLIGDDGFGPAVIGQLACSPLPAGVRLVDAGTSIREYLLDYLLLPELRPRRLIVVDAATPDHGTPGQVIRCTAGELPAVKSHDFSLHQFPTTNLLRELAEECDLEVICFLACPKAVPAAVAPGLSPAMHAAAASACAQILALVAPLAQPRSPRHDL